MRSFVLAAVLAVTSLSGVQAVASEADPESGADWIRRPRSEDIMSVWPKAALEKGQGGRATISCVVTVQGSVVDCEVLAEQPEGAGFGRAAVALTPQFAMRPATSDGRPVASRVRIPIVFPAFSPGRLESSNSLLANVPWIEAPTYDEVAAAYPDWASRNGMAGRANMLCTFAAEGRLGNCRVLQEEPKSHGFGRAARSLAPLFRGPALFTDGRSTRGNQVQIPVVFSLDMLSGGKPVIGKPRWAALPAGDALEAIYPAAASAKGVDEGRVRLKCRIVVMGGVDECEPFHEDPEGLGFGEAALKLTPDFRMSVWTPEGLPTVGGEVTIPIRFQGGAAPATASQ